MSVSIPSQGTHFSDGVRTGPIIGSSYIAGANVLSPSVMISSPIDQLPPGVFNAPIGVLDFVPAPVSTDSIMPAFTVEFAGDLPLVNVSGVGITIITYQGVQNVIQLDSARVITITGLGAGVTASQFFVFGWDQYGIPLTEQINGPLGATQASGNKAFLYIQAIYSSDTTTQNIAIGVGNSFGFPYLVADSGYLLIANWAGIGGNASGRVGDQRVATAHTNDVRGIITPNTDADGLTRLVVYYYPASADAQKYNLSSSGTINLITDALDSGNGSNEVTVSAAGHQLTEGEIITISGAISFNGLTASQLNISAPVSITGPDEFVYIVPGSAASAGGQGGGGQIVLNPARGDLYATTIGRFGVTQYSTAPF